MGDQGNKKAGYEYLLAYKITIVIYDYTVEFCKRWIDYKSRTKDQMEQAARSGTHNIPEGSKQQSLAGYIMLAGVTRGSQEELLKDYLAFARQNKIEVWDKETAIREIREIGEVWEIVKATPTLPNNPNFPDLPQDQNKAVNLMITLINQANFLIDKLIASLKEKHRNEGGFKEKLFNERKKARGY
jgi:four helix bundle suffix protein